MNVVVVVEVVVPDAPWDNPWDSLQVPHNPVV